jgi:xanthine dehydrogenase large subunit
MRRIGGGFGGKCVIATQHACAAAVAAVVTGRPVRFPLNRDDDFTISGGREEVEMDYQVAFNADGRISAIKAAATIDAGTISFDNNTLCNDAESTIVCIGDTFLIPSFSAQTIGSALNQVYSVPSLEVVVGAAKTNTQMRAPVRGPAEPEASYAIETIMDQIAHVTGLSPELVRERNFFNASKGHEMKSPNGTPIAYYTVPEMWDQLKRKCSFADRVTVI